MSKLSLGRSQGSRGNVVDQTPGVLTSSGSGVEGKSKMNRRFFQSLPLAALASVLAIAPGNIYATPIIVSGVGTGPGSGNVSLANMAGTFVGVAGGANPCLDFGFPAACQTTAPIQDAVSSMDTTNFVSGSTAADTIKDVFLFGPLPVVDFETVQSPLAGGMVQFNLTSIVTPATPVGNNCSTFSPSAVCAPGGGSPLILTQEGSSQVNVTFSVDLAAYTGTSATGTTPYLGVFSTNLSGSLPTMAGNPFSGAADTIPDILGFIGDGGTITSTWSAQESALSAVPEPLSFVLLGSGLVGLSLLGRCRRTRP